MANKRKPAEKYHLRLLICAASACVTADGRQRKTTHRLIAATAGERFREWKCCRCQNIKKVLNNEYYRRRRLDPA